MSSAIIYRPTPNKLPASTEDLALFEMKIVLIKILQRPGVVSIKKHAMRNRSLLFNLGLLVDWSFFAFSFGS